MAAPLPVVSLREATRTWFGISLQSFGGPAGQIAVMQRTLVEEKQWLEQPRFLHALSFCMLLPGPEAQQLAIYTGWLLNGWRGGLIAGSLFVLPGFLAMLVCSWVYVVWGETALLTGLFAGLAPAVVAVVAFSLVRMARKSLTGRWYAGLAVAAFLAVAWAGVPFPVVVAVAAGLGWAASAYGRGGVGGAAADEPAVEPAERPPMWRRNAVLLLGGVAVWWLPVGVAALLLGRDATVVDQGVFFAGTALVTFGGAYAVLAFVAQQAVHTYGWLSGPEMVRGLALAESTPGPLIMVVQFVAFLGAAGAPGVLPPLVAGVVGSALTVWVTFVPCFLFVFLGAPYVERLRHHRGLAAALAGISAAVVGVIGSLGLYFAVHTLFDRTVRVSWAATELPVWGSADPFSWALLALAAALLTRGWSPLRTFALCATLGMVGGM